MSQLFPIHVIFEREEDTLPRNNFFVCFLSVTDFSWHLSFTAWVGTGGPRSPCSIIFSLPSATPSLLSSLCELVSGVSCFWEGEGRAWEQQKGVSLTEPKDCCGLASWAVWQIQETSHGDSVPAQKRYWGK